MKTLATDVVRSRISHELKRDAEAVLSQLGLTVSDSIRMFLTQVALRGSIPFEIATPNAKTILAMRESESRAARLSNIKDLLDELEKEGEGPKQQ
jgi:DNA-damage-inducible protein J